MPISRLIAYKSSKLRSGRSSCLYEPEVNWDEATKVTYEGLPGSSNRVKIKGHRECFAYNGDVLNKRLRTYSDALVFLILDSR